MTGDRAGTAIPIEILLIDDNPGDVRLVREALREGRVLNRISAVADGEEALAFVHRRGAFAAAPRPDLILLDLNMPRKDGRAVLAELKSDPGLKTIPVVILTSSQAEQDIARSYELHANCYIVKPLELDRFIAALRTIEDFWLSIVKLPPR